ncbi:hypothetical protein IKP85_00650 [bacterium]|nr:hypothetical protein [bacterium]
MKKLILCITLGLMLFQAANGTPSNQATIGKIEESLYGFQYNDENMSSRLNRLEQSVYGKISSKSENERIAKLSKDVSADSIGQEIPPVEDTFAENPDYIAEEEMQETSDVSYPVVDELEMQIFKQVNKKDKIKERLAKLEQKTFNKTYNDDLSTRVDRLRAEIKPPSLMENRLAQSYNTFYDEEIPPQNTTYHLDKYVPPGSFDYEYYNDKANRLGNFYDDGLPNTASSYSSKPKKVSVSTIEKKLFRQSFNNETTEKRLARIENAMFGTEFSGDDIQTRMDRISSAYQAEKSAGRYDSNKFSQNVATAVQIGTLILMVLACIL